MHKLRKGDSKLSRFMNGWLNFPSKFSDVGGLNAFGNDLAHSWEPFGSHLPRKSV